MHKNTTKNADHCWIVTAYTEREDLSSEYVYAPTEEKAIVKFKATNKRIPIDAQFRSVLSRIRRS